MSRNSCSLPQCDTVQRFILEVIQVTKKGAARSYARGGSQMHISICLLELNSKTSDLYFFVSSSCQWLTNAADEVESARLLPRAAAGAISTLTR